MNNNFIIMKSIHTFGGSTYMASFSNGFMIAGDEQYSMFIKALIKEFDKMNVGENIIFEILDLIDELESDDYVIQVAG